MYVISVNFTFNLLKLNNAGKDNSNNTLPRFK